MSVAAQPKALSGSSVSGDSAISLFSTLLFYALSLSLRLLCYAFFSLALNVKCDGHGFRECVYL